MGNLKGTSTAMLLICTMVIAGTGKKLAEEEPPLCAQDCMPVCLQVAGATIRACEDSCLRFCEQISGRGSNGGKSIWLWIVGAA